MSSHPGKLVQDFRNSSHKRVCEMRLETVHLRHESGPDRTIPFETEKQIYRLSGQCR